MSHKLPNLQPNQCWSQMLKVKFVGDDITKILNPSPTYRNCHQFDIDNRNFQKCSRFSVTNLTVFLGLKPVDNSQVGRHALYIVAFIITVFILILVCSWFHVAVVSTHKIIPINSHGTVLRSATINLILHILMMFLKTGCKILCTGNEPEI